MMKKTAIFIALFGLLMLTGCESENVDSGGNKND
jgi:hypothetical protein